MCHTHTGEQTGQGKHFISSLKIISCRSDCDIVIILRLAQFEEASLGHKSILQLHDDTFTWHVIHVQGAPP